MDGKTIPVKIGNTSLTLKVAACQESQEQGYMNATDQPNENDGILFIYSTNQRLAFWMKDVNFNLDIIFFDSNMEYVSHTTMEKYLGQRDYELPLYTSEKPAKYAVEVKEGWFNKNSFPGCTISF